MIQAVILGATAIVCLGVMISLISRDRSSPNAHQASSRPSTRNGFSWSRVPNGDLRNRRPNNNTECVICFEVRPQVEIYPCGHHSLCEDCITKLISSSKKTCPMCRSSIKGYRVIEDEE